MSRVKKPCPGCKTTSHHRKSPDDVCNQCVQRLKTAIEMEEFKRSNLADGRVVVMTVERDYALPGFYDKHLSLPHSEQDALQKALHRIITLHIEQKVEVWHGQKADLYVPPLPKGEHREWQIGAVMPKEHAKAINALFLALDQALRSAAANAFEKGRNLLLGVASGDVTVSALNEASKRGPR